MTEQASNSQESWSDEQKWSYLIRHERIGEILVRQGKLSISQLDAALKEQEVCSKHLGEIIVEKKILTLDEILAALEKQKLINNASEQSIKQLKTKERE